MDVYAPKLQGTHVKLPHKTLHHIPLCSLGSIRVEKQISGFMSIKPRSETPPSLLVIHSFLQVILWMFCTHAWGRKQPPASMVGN